MKRGTLYIIILALFLAVLLASAVPAGAVRGKINLPFISLEAPYSGNG